MLLFQLMQRIDDNAMRLERALVKQCQNLKNRTRLCQARLAALSPLAVLSRGYALLYRLDENGERKIVSKLEQARIKESLTVQLSDGVLDVTVENLRG